MALRLASPKKESGKDMSFIEHLDELRRHLIRSLIAILLAGVYFFIDKTLLFSVIIFGPKDKDFLTYRAFCALARWMNIKSVCISPPSYQLQALGVGETFSLHIKCAFLFGFVVAFPYVFWEFWSFIKPGLYTKERRAASGVVFVCSALFLLGVAFGYFIISPFAVNYLVTYTVPEVVNVPTASSYINYMLLFTLPIGLIFEMPIVAYFLTKVGVITPKLMQGFRKQIFVILLILAAIITPSPDAVSQILTTAPMYLLFEISILVSKRVERRIAKRDAMQEEEAYEPLQDED